MKRGQKFWDYFAQNPQMISGDPKMIGGGKFLPPRSATQNMLEWNKVRNSEIILPQTPKWLVGTPKWLVGEIFATQKCHPEHARMKQGQKFWDYFAPNPQMISGDPKMIGGGNFCHPEVPPRTC